uniref:Uncharacterized protein n=1 Tax=Trichobilharzia regenti TaxID=157069 RepID=A0AA85IVR4_TRIRE|nr:unnamed protein product [Trichobilharzia regenti]
MRYFLLFITSFILLHVQQSTQDDLLKLKVKKSYIERKLVRNAEHLVQNSANLVNLTKVIQDHIENINALLSPGGLSVDKYISCRRKQMEGQSGVKLMKSLVDIIVREEKYFGIITTDTHNMKQCFQDKAKSYEEIHQLTNQIRTLYYVIEAQTQSVFEKKLFMQISSELEKLIPAE